MAGSITVRLTSSCDTRGGSGLHLTFATTGAKEMVLPDVHRDDLLASPMTDEEAVTFVRGLVKLGQIGRTNAQVRTLFEAGVTVTV